MQYFFSNKTIYEVFLKFSLNQDVKTVSALESISFIIKRVFVGNFIDVNELKY